MGRHKKIESILLHEFTAHEERSLRAIKIIEHQFTKICQLEKSLQNQRTANALLTELDKERTVEYDLIQQEVLNLQTTLRQLKNSQFEIIKEVEESRQNINAPNINPYEIQPTNISDPAKSFQESQKINKMQCMNEASKLTVKFQKYDNMLGTLECVNSEIEHLTEKLETCREIDNHIQRKCERLQNNVRWLKKERDQVVSHLEDLSHWCKRVEAIIFDFSSGVGRKEASKSSSGDSSIFESKRTLWRTAREFFTPEESHFFLTSNL